MKPEFEMKVDDVKTSRVKDDTCPLSGEFVYEGVKVKVAMVFTSDALTFDEMFGGVGKTVTFAVVDNAQQKLGE